ncbi:MarR family winged helix-turn-helix transcriptional regulator [Arthrobacter bambusae]|jgi:DNA-binding MarR family transcriptional regulator|uniref:MarR family winged helix-turn-helix transcriptional regulator n=1 Tax=Arthrobacter TaxID=1663 RepID=UPI001F51066E|nr:MULTISPECIES: MarR family winged helix-turn-helix transcriptional regulator [Arthrobacter]MCI0141086.1 MarR family winged helix-turn-helix transcriptional regulator [Arthrobacter bambusae]UYY82740.1 MarR family winged helix-turn-helix transcriptional regulator [Arthrobacter sp. YA7-1]
MNTVNASDPATDPAVRDYAGADAWSLTGVITRLRRVLRSSVRQEFPWESLPMAQVEVMQRLADEPGMGVSDLADRQRLATNTVSSLVQQMVTAGFVERTPRPGDRRAVNLILTQTGTEILAAWQAANDRRLGQALERLPEAYQNVIENAVPALAALAALLEAEDQTRNRDQARQSGTRP